MTQSKSWLTVEREQGPNILPVPETKGSWRASQNICMLPFQYGQQLEQDLAAKDALYALSELFLFAATAEVQFLNLIRSLIEHELSFIGEAKFHAISLLNLRYIKAQLSSHERHLAETVNILKNRQWLGWPSSPSEESKKTAAMLITNYQFLVELAKNLGRDTEQGMATLANASVLDESRRSANNAMRVQRLTVLATIFIPLSFICAVWGMNFKEMGTGTLPMWWWIVTAVPVLIYPWSSSFSKQYAIISNFRYTLAKLDSISLPS
jgi:Mg2+ and Co2+ transporter CorA